MKVCQIGTIEQRGSEGESNPKALGGIQAYLLDLVEYLLAKGHKITFIGKIFHFRKTDNLNYIEVLNQITSTNKFLVKLFLKSLFKKIEPDTIIHAHRPDHLAVFGSFKRNPSIVTLHGQQAHTVFIRKKALIRFIYSRLEKFALKKARLIIAVDRRTKDFYTQLYPSYEDKIRIIPTAINTTIFQPIDKTSARQKLALSKDDQIILYVGRIEPPKRVKEIIMAFEEVLKYSPGTKLLLVGYGVEFSHVFEYVNRMSLNKSVSFLGTKRKDELPLIYSAADISVLFSGNEGSPLSVKESLACGIPVIANDVGDIPDVIVDGRNGYITKNESIEELASKMSMGLQKANRMKEYCIESIQIYSPEKVFMQVLELYEAISKN